MYKTIKTLLFLLCFFSLQSLYAQKQIAVEDFTEQGTFSTKSLYGLRWMKDGARYSTLTNNNIVIHDVRTGKQVDTLLQGDSLSTALRMHDYRFSPDEDKLLLMSNKESIYRHSYTAIYHLYDLKKRSLQKLAPGRQAYATFSPQGDKVAYTQKNNLFYYDIPTNNTVQITDDGEPNAIINGSTDWVYEEELYLTKAFSWSSNGARIAYYRFDERAVKEFTLQLFSGTQPYPYPHTFKYPKAGEDNAKVSIHIYSITDTTKVRVKLNSDADEYIPRIRFTKDPLLLSVERLNRQQNHREILHVDARTGNTKQILSEKSNTYVDVNFCNDLYYLKDGKHFIYSSEESGFKHFYLYKLSGKLVRAITSGKFEAETLIGIDERGRKPLLYYISTEGGVMERHIYKVPVTGGNKVLLSKQSGTHSVSMSKDFSHYVSYYANPTTPLQVRLYRTKNNQLIKLIEDNNELKAQSAAYGFVDKEFFSFPTSNNELLHGFLLKPKNMEPNKQYPLLIYQYSGPGVQSVRKTWGGSSYSFHQMLTQRGVIVAVIDTQGTDGRGVAFKKVTYGKMGKTESEDLIAAATYFSALPYVDAARLGIWGWSYGGYMSSLSLFLPNSPYALAIAVAPVGSWRFYDTIYTERYLKRPQDNPSGYDDYSPISHAKTMRGKYLLIHGTGDDNVHFQNAIAIQDALIKENKQFSTFYYPNEAHALQGVRTHLYHLLTDFILTNL